MIRRLKISFKLRLFIICFPAAGILHWLAVFITSDDTYMHAWLETILNFTIKLIFVLPVYWFVFVKLNSKTIFTRMMVNILLMPAYLLLTVNCYYIIASLVQIITLSWPYSFWDYYFGALIYLLQFGILYIYENHYNLKRQKEKENQLLRAAYESEIRSLKAQIEPHFLFNSLHSISSSVPSNLKHTRNLIVRLADTFRFALNTNAVDFITIKEEIDFIKSYLSLETERFKDKLSVHYQIEETALTSSIPPMLLQPLIENCMKHGVSNSMTPVTILIIIEQHPEGIRFEVSDNGAGIEYLRTEEIIHKGRGLQNVSERLKLLYNTELIIEPVLPSGFKCSFILKHGKS
jgi:two-component system, LytTR family, sensor kinase